MKVPRYPKIWNLGHSAIRELFDAPVDIEEKVDGSQFSFMMGDTGEILMRSKREPIREGFVPRIFKNTVDHILSRVEVIKPGLVYRGEAFFRPKHSHVKYNRCPRGHLVLFDIQKLNGDRLNRDRLLVEAGRLGVDAIPSFSQQVKVTVQEQLEGFLEKESFLGGSSVEGVVIKSRTLFSLQFGDLLMGKLVSDQFKESQKAGWKRDNPTRKDILVAIVKAYKTDARFRKALQHLEEEDKITGELKDIGPLMGEASKDIEEECSEEIKDILYKHFRKQIIRGVVKGIPSWYKALLLKKQFEQ